MICYRHPDREAYVRCQRCEQLICTGCQIEASVGFLCPACAGGTQEQLHARARRAARQANGQRSPLTTAIIAINVVIWLLQLLPGSIVTEKLYFNSMAFYFEPWRVVTSGFAHDSGNFLHLALNMYSLWVFGAVLEPMLGRIRFAALYLISIIAGSAAVMWLADVSSFTLGASGAIFGLMGAYFVIMRKLGQPSGQLLGLIAINLAFGFFMSGISWQAHLGGLVGGLLVAVLFVSTRRLNQKTQQLLGLIGILGLSVGLNYAGFYLRVLPALGY